MSPSNFKQIGCDSPLTIFRRLGKLTLFVVLLLAAIGVAENQHKEELDSLRAERESLRSERERLQRRVKMLETESASMSHQLRAKELTLSASLDELRVASAASGSYTELTQRLSDIAARDGSPSALTRRPSTVIGRHRRQPLPVVDITFANSLFQAPSFF